MNNHLMRQVKDIQVQAERLIQTNAAIEDLEEFNDYNIELKTYLLATITDPMVLTFIQEIPDKLINHKEIVRQRVWFAALTFLFSGLIALYTQRVEQQDAISTVREIRGKYASIEFLLKRNS